MERKACFQGDSKEMLEHLKGKPDARASCIEVRVNGDAIAIPSLMDAIDQFDFRLARLLINGQMVGNLTISDMRDTGSMARAAIQFIGDLVVASVTESNDAEGATKVIKRMETADKPITERVVGSDN